LFHVFEEIEIKIIYIIQRIFNFEIQIKRMFGSTHTARLSRKLLCLVDVFKKRNWIFIWRINQI
jgi:hypothetical protein